MTHLSVNVNKVAVLRNSRGGAHPDPCRAAELALRAGAQGITVHPRPDGRHIRAADVRALRRVVGERGEFNIEGNPFAPAQGEYPGLVALVAETRPHQVTLVPDADGQITSDHGFSVPADLPRLTPLVAELKHLGARVSVFMDAEAEQLGLLQGIGVDRIELYTGPFAEAFVAGDTDAALSRFADAARRAQAASLGVNAGHDLSQANLQAFLAAVPEVLEVSIGHALFEEAIYEGLATTVGRYLALLRR